MEDVYKICILLPTHILGARRRCCTSLCAAHIFEHSDRYAKPAKDVHRWARHRRLRRYYSRKQPLGEGRATEDLRQWCQCNTSSIHEEGRLYTHRLDKGLLLLVVGERGKASLLPLHFLGEAVCRLAASIVGFAVRAGLRVFRIFWS
jgi:hypothetical protein